MINHIIVSDRTDVDVMSLKDDINVFLPEDERYALVLSALLDLEFYPRADSVSKSFRREVYTGYRELLVELKEGAVLTASKDVLEGAIFRDVHISKEILSVNYGNVLSVTEKTDDHSLENAKIVFLAGRGIGSKANYEKLKEKAKKYGASVGCTRPVSMNGWESYDSFVGISGKSLNADICVTFGVSGSGPLIKGLENVKTVIAINTDRDALIFDYADYGIVGDLNKVLAEI